MQALVARLQPPVCGCIPSLVELCQETHQGKTLTYGGGIPHVDDETAEIIQTELMAGQHAELRLVQSLLLQIHLSGELTVPATKFEEAMRGMTVLRFRIHAQYLGNYDIEAPDPKVPPELQPLLYWFLFLGHIQDLLCSALLAS